MFKPIKYLVSCILYVPVSVCTHVPLLSGTHMAAVTPITYHIHRTLALDMAVLAGTGVYAVACNLKNKETTITSCSSNITW